METAQATVAQLNFQALFESLPGSYLILQPNENFTIVAVSDHYLLNTKTSRAALLGRGLFEIFPDNPEDSLATGTHNLRDSLNRVIRDKQPDTMSVQKYDIRRPAEEGGGFEERYWSPINTPVFGEGGAVSVIIHRVEDVTEFMQLKQQKKEQHQRTLELQEKTSAMAGEIFNREKEIQHTAAALKNSNERYTQLTSLLPVGVFHTDAHGRVLYVNPYWYEMTKLSLKMIEQKPWYELIYALDRTQIAATWQQDKNQSLLKTEFRFVTAEGELKWMLAHIQSEADSLGNITAYIGTITDITERKQQEDREKKQMQMLAEIDRAKTLFFSNISHELRTPLTLILGPLADALADAAHLPSKDQERLSLIYRNALRLLKLVNSLLDFSRVEANKVQAMYEPVNLSTTTQNLVSLFTEVIERAGLKLQLDLPDITDSVYVDRDMYEKIIFNLLSNALKFTFQGTISITLKKCADHVELCVQDTGIGIEEQALSHIFERFYRVEGAEGRSHEGSGIGLAMVKELVNLHYGNIRVESQVGQGSQFTVTLPLGFAHLPKDHIKNQGTATAQRTAKMFIEEATQWLATGESTTVAGAATYSTSTEPQNSANFTDKAKILVIDDNQDMCYYLRDLLKPFWEVAVAHDGVAALQMVQQTVPDLILSDLMMPHLDGAALIRQLKAREETRFIPIILLSARAGEEARIEGLQIGADDYLAKPFSAKELLARIKIHVELRQLRVELEKKVVARTQELVQALQQKEEQQQQRAAEAEAYKKRQEQFIDTLCHEVRNPLNGAYSSTSLLTDTLDLLEKLFKVEENKTSILLELKNAKEQIQNINQCTQQQKIIVDDVLSLSKLENTVTALHANVFELTHFLKTTTRIFNAQIAQKDLQFRWQLPENPTWLKADAQRLSQVVINLIGNAIKFTERGQIVVTATLLSSATNTPVLRVMIQDTGIGMTPEEMTHLFEPFVQASRRTSERYTGSGLGLTISKKIVTMMGGDIQVQSQKGQGSVFSFTINCESLSKEEQAKIKFAPATRRQSAGHTHTTPTSLIEALEHKKILIVEDNIINQTVLRKLLEKYGCYCEVANNGLEAVVYCEQQSFDLIFMDIEMPVMGGLAATHKIREQEQKTVAGRTPIIGVSGYTRKEIEQSALDAGMDAYITKPYEKEQIYQYIATWTTRSPDMYAKRESTPTAQQPAATPHRMRAPAAADSPQQTEVIRLEETRSVLRNCCF